MRKKYGGFTEKAKKRNIRAREVAFFRFFTIPCIQMGIVDIALYPCILIGHRG